MGESGQKAEDLRRAYAQSWRESDVELGIKRPMVSASAAAAANNLEKTSGSEGDDAEKSEGIASNEEEANFFGEIQGWSVLMSIFRCFRTCRDIQEDKSLREKVLFLCKFPLIERHALRLKWLSCSAAMGESGKKAEELRREYAQSWRDSDVSLGIKMPKRPMVSAAAVAAGAVLENSSGAEGMAATHAAEDREAERHDAEKSDQFAANVTADRQDDGAFILASTLVPVEEFDDQNDEAFILASTLVPVEEFDDQNDGAFILASTLVPVEEFDDQKAGAFILASTLVPEMDLEAQSAEEPSEWLSWASQFVSQVVGCCGTRDKSET
eukprot:symbB.v1.2.002769.t1/scaffold141.1/size300911/20